MPSVQPPGSPRLIIAEPSTTSSNHYSACLIERPGQFLELSLVTLVTASLASGKFSSARCETTVERHLQRDTD